MRYLYTIRTNRNFRLYVEGFDGPSLLPLSADDRYQAIALEKVAHGLKRVKVGDFGSVWYVSVHKALRDTFLAKLLDRVRPQYVAHEPGCWRLAESIQLQDAPDNVTGADGKMSDDVK